jgi:cysteinyl-tRNA synthetase
VRVLSIDVDPQKVQRLELLKQHYHELIEAKNKEIRESEKEQERLRKALRVIPDACIDKGM